MIGFEASASIDINIPGLSSSKAVIEIYRREELLDEIEVMYNPPEYTTSKSAKYTSTSILGMSTPIKQFQAGDADTLTLEVFLDTTVINPLELITGGDDVREYVRRIEVLVQIDKELHAPPYCIFRWGANPEEEGFKATVDKVDTTYTKFQSDGTPVRAKVKLTFTEYKTFEEIVEKTTKHSADLAKVYIVEDGDSLWLIAYK